MPEAASIGAVLITQGLPGIVILVLGYVCYGLYRRLDKVHADRIADAQTVQNRAISALERNTAVLEKLSDNFEQLTAAINKRRESKAKP
jgi:hypothetical protein